MSYHRYSNIAELLQADLTTKLREGLMSNDFVDRSGNCSGTKTGNKCVNGGKCRQKMVIFEVTCKCCNAKYVGNTQQNLKERMNGHFT